VNAVLIEVVDELAEQPSGVVELESQRAAQAQVVVQFQA
jgi:hypothetical protein